jgi:SAM-dependent methyltransferase
MLELLWNAPVSANKMSQVFETLALQANHSVLDVGCGCGEVLIRLHERFGISGRGIDVSNDCIEEACRRAEGRVNRDSVRFSKGDSKAVEIEPGSLDLAICLGSTHAFGLGHEAYVAALQRLQHWVRPGGRILVAEPFMQLHASPEYRAMIGDFPPDDRSHTANVLIGRNLGLTPLGAWASSLDEWDEFEWAYQRTTERRAVERPEDKDAARNRDCRREWMEAYLRWGRETLGYGTYLFEN